MGLQRWKTLLSPLVRRALLAASQARFAVAGTAPRRINLAAGDQRLPGWLSIDLSGDVDLKLDLAQQDLPFADASVEAVACVSAINYFTHSRAEELVRETHRVLRPGGVARFAVQDLRRLATQYVAGDRSLFDQKTADGRDRFPGETLGDKFAGWLYGYPTLGGPCRHIYDYESLARLFSRAGFREVAERGYRESLLPDVALLDNRPEQMFFLEAVK